METRKAVLGILAQLCYFFVAWGRNKINKVWDTREDFPNLLIHVYWWICSSRKDRCCLNKIKINNMRNSLCALGWDTSSQNRLPSRNNPHLFQCLASYVGFTLTEFKKMQSFILSQADWYSNFHLKQKQITKTNIFSGISCQEVTNANIFTGRK